LPSVPDVDRTCDNEDEEPKAMANRPQFSLKAILGIMAVLSVPLAMLATQYGELAEFGLILALPVVGGCVGYCLGGWKHVGVGALIGLIVMWVLYAATMKIVSGQYR